MEKDCVSAKHFTVLLFCYFGVFLCSVQSICKCINTCMHMACVFKLGTCISGEPSSFIFYPCKMFSKTAAFII